MILKILIAVIVIGTLSSLLVVYLPKLFPYKKKKQGIPRQKLDVILEEAEDIAARKEAVEQSIDESIDKIIKAKSKINN